MENKVYYGEYTLKHWIDLLLTKNIILPEYQRLFVWKPEKVIKLIQSISDESFVPPVVIGSYEKNGKRQNLIIDGQQRLTSLLLAYLGLYPKKECFKPKVDDLVTVANDNDDAQDSEDEKFVLGWTFNVLLQNPDIQDSSNSKIKDDRYDKLDLSEQNIRINDDFFETHYLGFSYLIPQGNQQQYFSTVFRDINAEGEKLSVLETRKSLYFLADGFNDFFDPPFINTISIKNVSSKKDEGGERIDFVRYLALLFQYKKETANSGISDADNIARGYGRKLEDYYKDFIDAVINRKDKTVFCQYKDEYKKTGMSNLEKTLKQLEFAKKNFSSIIDADIYLFGLIYVVVLMGKEIDMAKKQDLVKALDQKITDIKENNDYGMRHKKTPAALKYLRLRMLESIKLYEIFVK